MMDDEKLFVRAKLYVSAMAKGINPTTGEYVSECDSLADQRIQRCMEYVLEYMERPRSAGRARPFSITPEQKAAVQVSEEPIGINEVAKRINAVTGDGVKGISGVALASWLVSEGYLSSVKDSEGHTRKKLNDRSFELDIIEVDGEYDGRPYRQLRYGPTAQRFLIDNLEKIYGGR